MRIFCRSVLCVLYRLASSTAVVDNQGIMVEAETCKVFNNYHYKLYFETNLALIFKIQCWKDENKYVV